jgi:hypothetical protein
MKVPKFKNIKKERKFWDAHESTDYLDDFEEAKDVVFVRPKSAGQIPVSYPILYDESVPRSCLSRLPTPYRTALVPAR